MTHRVTLLPGDGIGLQVARAVQRIIDAAGVAIEWDEHRLREDAPPTERLALLDTVERAIRRSRVALQGKFIHPFSSEYQTFTIAIRQRLELFANLRPIQSMLGVSPRYDKIDMIMVRENLHDVYSGAEHEVVPGVVQSMRITTRRASERIVRFAFETCKQRGREKLSVIHKANIMKLADGMLLECARRIRPEFPEIGYEELIVDNTAMQLMSNPYRFDVLLLPNLYGDILSDLAGGLAGGWGTVPSVSVNRELAVFESIHGASPELVGTPWVNPLSLLTSAVMMLRYLGEVGAANRIEEAIHDVIGVGGVRTPDMGGEATTDQIVDALCAALS